MSGRPEAAQLVMAPSQSLFGGHEIARERFHEPGTNRIVKQRVKEWYTEIEGERNARLLDEEPASTNPRWSIRSIARYTAFAITRPPSVIRQRFAQKPVV